MFAAIHRFKMGYSSHVESLFFHSRCYTSVAMLMFMASSWSSCSSKRLSKPCIPYKCGDMNFQFPMWGGNQSSSCGRKQLELKCIDNQYPMIDINSQRFHVLNLDERSNATGTIRVAPMDFWDSICPDRFVNTTMNNSFFNYRSHVRQLSLFYGCPQASSTQVGNNYTCFIKGTTSAAYYADEEQLLGNFMPILTACQTRVIVPVLSTSLDQLKNGSTTLQETLKQGFDIWWVDVQEPGKNGPGSIQIVLMIAAPVMGTGLVFCIFFFCFKRKILSITLTCFWRKFTKNDRDIEAIIRGYGPLPLTRYTFSYVKLLTSCFKDKVGEGGYGCVYKGKQLDGRLVAVKVLDTTKGNGEEFINEVLSISQTSHVNIVTLLGFCLERNHRALIYEFMPNGSLEKFIYDKVGSTTDQYYLGWEKLYQIAIGIAQGLEYLHHGCNTRILHFDIKPHNILLDEDFHPKISDFGLAKLCTRKESFVSVLDTRGTIGYIAPEMFSRNFGEISHKSDVYSYGMMILNMVGGRNKADIKAENSSDSYFPHQIYKQLVRQNDLGMTSVITEQENETAKKMILVGLWCIQTDPSQRPSMKKVLDMLEGSVDNLQIPPKPFLSSPPSRSPSESPSSSML